VLWCCWLGGRKGIRPVKKLSDGALACLEHSADLHMAQLMPLPLTVSCFRNIQIGFTFLLPAHLGSPGQRAVKRVCVCVCYLTRSSATADRSHDVMCQSKSCQLLLQNNSVETTGTSSPEQREVMEWENQQQQQQQQPLNGRLSGTTRVGRYQKKHSPTHTHPGQRTSFITFLHLQWSTASSLFSLRAW